MDLTVLATFGLLLVRPAMLMAIAPGFGGATVPTQVKVALTVLIAVTMAPTVAMPAAGDTTPLTLIVAREMTIGLALALMVRALIAGVEFAGHLSSQQIGFSYAATVDPSSGVRNTMLTSLYGTLATLSFLGINGHHEMLRAMAMSYAALPIGGGSINESLLTSVREMLALVFTVGLRLAAPIVIVLLIVELAVGLISRAAPALNFMVIGYPVRIIVGLTVLAALLSTIPSLTASLSEQAIELALRFAAAFR
jgi:flagellar biosynthetic protein FliR